MANLDSMPLQSTPEGRAYKAYMKNLQRAASNFARAGIEGMLDKELAAELSAANESILAMKDVVGGPAAVHQDTVLGQMTVMYANDDWIGNRVMPKLFSQGALSGVYFEYGKRDRLAYPDDSMLDRTDPNEVSQTRIKNTYKLQPRSMIELLDWLLVQNQSAPLNEIVDVVNNALEGMLFNKELRIAAAVNNSSNYGGNTVSLSSSDRWDTGTGGDPFGVIDAAKAACWRGSGPGKWVIVVSLPLHNILKRHKVVLDSIKYTMPGLAAATPQLLAQFFEVDEYIVGAARKDPNNIGQAAPTTYPRIWSDNLAILRVAETPSLRNAAWGYDLQDNPTVTELFWLADRGAKGMYKARTSHSDQQLVVAPTTGYLITNPIG